MTRKKKGRSAGLPTQLEVYLNPAQMEQFQNICTVLMQSPEELAREIILDAMWKETLQILKNVAISYSLDEMPGMQGTRTGRSSSQDLTELDPPTLIPETQARKKGLRGGEADEESLPEGTRNADLERHVIQARHPAAQAIRQSVQGQASGQLISNAPGSQP